MATLNDTLIFRYPENYRDNRVTVHGSSAIVSQATDNDYNTFTSEADLNVNVADVNGNATRITHIALKTKNVDRYAFTPTGGSGAGFTNRAVVSMYQTLDAQDVSPIVNGLHNELYELPSPVTATSVRLQVSGTGTEIYNLMFLNLLVSIPDPEFASVVPLKADRTGLIVEDDNGGVDRSSPLGADRWKWTTEYALKVTPITSQTSVPAFLKLLSDHPEIVHMPEPARYPDRWYLGTQVLLAKPTPLRTPRLRESGYLVPFRIAEV